MVREGRCMQRAGAWTAVWAPISLATIAAVLEQEDIEVFAYTKESHGITARDMTFEEIKANYRKNEINCPDLKIAKEMIEDVLKVRDSGDTAGGVIEVIIRGVPAGLGEPVFDKISADLSKAVMSIGAVKASN